MLSMYDSMFVSICLTYIYLQHNSSTYSSRNIMEEGWKDKIRATRMSALRYREAVAMKSQQYDCLKEV